MAFISKWKIFCLQENKFIYIWDIQKPTRCPNNINHSANILSINSIFRVYKYKTITNLDSPFIITGYNFYRCDTLNGNINISLNNNKYRYIIFQKLSNVNTVVINNQFTLRDDMETIKLYYNGIIWINLPLDTYDGEIDRLLEPSFYNNSPNDDYLNILSFSKNPDTLSINAIINANNHNIINVSDPVNPTDAVNRNYIVDTMNSNLKIYQLYHIKPTGTNGGTPIKQQWATITVNYLNGIDNDVLLNNNIITLNNGKYKFIIQANFHNTEGTCLRLVNITDNVTEKVSNNYNITETTNNILLYAHVNVTSTKEYIIQYYVFNNQQDTGLGYPLGIPNQYESYVDITIEKTIMLN